MRWADGFIAVDWGTTNRRAYRVDPAGQCADEFEDREGRPVGAQGEFPAAVAEIRSGSATALAPGRDGRVEPRLGGGALRAVPGRPRRSRRQAGLAGEREAIVPGVSYVGDGRADVMRGEEVQLLGAIAAGVVDPNGLDLPSRHPQ